jgi:undecaprenyl-diphosphatase
VLLILSGTAAAGATMAWAQVTLTMHYPTDTIGGFCTAMAILPATALLVDAFAGRRRDMADTLGR